MRMKIRVCALVLILLLTLGFSAFKVTAQVYGPKTPYLHIRNYAAPDKEFLALEEDEIDITDWPLDAETVARFSMDPNIRLAAYSAIDMFQYDINNQRWPTGVETPRDYDPETDSYKHHFDPTNEWDLRAWQFRLALAYMANRSYIQTEILKGYGNMMYTWMPVVPAMAGWIDYELLDTTSFVAPYGGITIPSLIYPMEGDTAMADDLLNAAGFTRTWEGDPDGVGPLPYGMWREDPRNPGNPIPSLVFWIRLDDPDRKAAGEKLRDDLLAMGVPVEDHVAEKTVNFKTVMIEYNYHLYTGGYGYGADPFDSLYGLFHSSQYWGGTQDSSLYGTGWSGGYQGFVHDDYDVLADKSKNGKTYAEVYDGTVNALAYINKYVASIPLWSSVAYQAYRTGWEEVVNHEGYGPSWGVGGVRGWSFFNMRHPTRKTIRWGFKSNAEAIHIWSSEWVWDAIILDQIYDPLIARNPYNLAKDTGKLAMATSWSTGLWDTNKIYVTFTIVPNATFHDGTPVTPEDVKFSLEFGRDAGPGVVWGWSSVKDIVKVDTKAEDPSLGDWDVRVYFSTGTYWAVHLAGFWPVVNKRLWMAANTAKGWGYNQTTHTFTPDANRFKVREYHPWEEDIYDASTGGPGSDGILDLRQDGTGPWIYVGSDPLLMEWYELEANRNYHWSQATITSSKSHWFWSIGDVNENRLVEETDMTLIAHALWTTPADTPGTGWWQWNEKADLSDNDLVDVVDLSICGRNYGTVAG